MTPDVTADTTPTRSKPPPSVRHARLLRKGAARRERNRLRQHRELLKHIGRGDQARIEAKRERQEAYLLRVETDKIKGREEGRIARQLYRKEQEAAALRAARQPRQPQSKSEPRPADTYRAARKRLNRGKRMALVLWAQRTLMGETRSAADRRRRHTAMSAEVSAS